MRAVLRAAVAITLFAVVFGPFALYAVRRSARLVPRLGARRAWLWTISLACLGLPMAIYGLWSHPGLWGALDLPFWVTHFLFGLYMTFVLYLAAADLLWAVARRAFHLPAAWGERVWAVVVTLSVVSAAVGLVQVLVPVPVERVEVPIPGLPRGLDGLRIVQISDLHVGSPVRRGFVERVVRQANALQPDLVVITGDIVHAPTLAATRDVEPLGALEARRGVFAVTGNHDSPLWLPVLEGLGVHVLTNDHVEVERDGARICLVGLPGIPHPPSATDRPDIEAALRDVPADCTRLLLVHDPTENQGASSRGFQLQLSGHTHGGQFYPWAPIMELLAGQSAGLQRHGGMRVYVSRGTGWWGPPNRFLVPAEMTVITLRAG